MEMAKATPWYENDKLWKAIEPVLFSNERIVGTVKEVDDLLMLTKIPAGASILDLCCGIGRHSLELARRGYKVTAVDRTSAYLKKAKNLAAKEKLRIEFVEKDMRQFCRPETFDCVLNLFTSFGYFESRDDDEKVIANVRNSLKVGGIFVLEMIGKEIIARVFNERRWEEHDGLIVLTECKVCDNWSRVSNRWIVLTKTGRNEITFTHRIYSAVELCGLLSNKGFKSVEVFGNLGGSAYDHKAQRLVIMAKKRFG
jgi:SAM-dependent methyltransferase